MDKDEFKAQFDCVVETPEQLLEAIENMPRTYERLANDPEWNTPRVTYFKEITGAFALWAVRQGSGYKCPPNLEKIISYLDTCLRKEFVRRNEDARWGEMGYGEFSLCEINRMLFSILWNLSLFQDWNTEECLGKDWLDLHAILHNVCLSIREERRLRDAKSVEPKCGQENE